MKSSVCRVEDEPSSRHLEASVLEVGEDQVVVVGGGTLDRTAVHVPNAAFADMQIENFGAREMIWYHPQVRLRSDTTPDQVRYVLVEVRRMLYAHPRVHPDPARIRFQGIGTDALLLEVFAYVTTSDYGEYLEVAEDLNLRILDVVAESGTSLAVPTQSVTVEEPRHVDKEIARAATQKVREWRGNDELYLPTFPREEIDKLRGTIEYPPKGSPKAGPGGPAKEVDDPDGDE